MLTGKPNREGLFRESANKGRAGHLKLGTTKRGIKTRTRYPCPACAE